MRVVEESSYEWSIHTTPICHTDAWSENAGLCRMSIELHINEENVSDRRCLCKIRDRSGWTKRDFVNPQSVFLPSSMDPRAERPGCRVRKLGRVLATWARAGLALPTRTNLSSLGTDTLYQRLYSTHQTLQCDRRTHDYETSCV